MEEEEVREHNKEGDCWIILQGKVYDVSDYLNTHPGGKSILLKFGGKDGTVPFTRVGHFSQQVHSLLTQHYLFDVVRFYYILCLISEEE